jgi:branched-chain amino acid transport system substrate-binding protein
VGDSILGYNALTKIQSLLLIAIIFVAAVGGGTAFILWRTNLLPSEDIRIGVCADLDNYFGKAAWQGAVLASEQINAEGGVLGRNFTVVAEDDDTETQPIDLAVSSNALTKLITVDHADYVVTVGLGATIVYEDIVAEHKKILFDIGAVDDEFTQRVLDDYDKYKYFFRVHGLGNESSGITSNIESILTLGNYTGFTKVAYLVEDIPVFKQMAIGMDDVLPEHGFEIVYRGIIPPATIDFTSYFAAIEASGAEILAPIIVSQASIPLVKEWCDRQSPFVVWGCLSMANSDDFWKITDGKCEDITFLGLSIVAGYPLTNKTVPTREAFIERWGNPPPPAAANAYDVVRFILPEAIKRAGTTETEAVIMALEKIDVETSAARHFVFTSSHDVMIGTTDMDEPHEEYLLPCMFQWQNATQVPVYPKKIMEEAGASYMFPDWPGPWNK